MSRVLWLPFWLTLSAMLLGPAVRALTLDEVEITGQVLYDSRGNSAARPAVADILRVYASNPIYMYMKSQGWHERDSRGAPLFAAAKAATNKALAEVARTASVNVITVPGGVRGGDRPAPDLTQQVIDRLPIYHVHGKVLFGRKSGAVRIAEVNTAAILAAIPAWQEAQPLAETDARFHLLRRRYLEELSRVVHDVARQGSYDTMVERGGVTSRLGAVPDLTLSAIRMVDT